MREEVEGMYICLCTVCRARLNMSFDWTGKMFAICVQCRFCTPIESLEMWYRALYHAASDKSNSA